MFNDNRIKVSLVIPCHNAKTKILKCLHSLEEIDFPEEHYEILFIDDCSTDNTTTIINEFLKKHSNCTLLKTEVNSGSPSKPRNIGIKKAKGEYIYFIDCDDEVLPQALKTLYALASKKDADIIRSNLLVETNGKQQIRNEISNFSKNSKKPKKIKKIIKNQSTTADSFIRTELLHTNNITWNEAIRMGEDTLFLIDVLLASNTIIYNNKPVYIYHKTVNLQEASSTQTYGERELENHLIVWQEAEKNLAEIGFSYFAIRGEIALKNLFQSIIKFYRGDINQALFHELSQFINQHSQIINKFNLSTRFEKAMYFLSTDKYESFFQTLKPHLLIAGHDLKFIESILEPLKDRYDIRIDKWSGHDTHNVSNSENSLDWADIIFCEWLLGNAVWYSRNKLPHQKLIVRMHRSELTSDYGHKVTDKNVNLYCTVGLYTMEKMIETFGYNRGKIRLVPNYINVNKYQTSNNHERVYNLGIVGILPARKGYLEAIKLLKHLKEKDSRYNLNVFGKMPKELPWVINNKKEKQYFHTCDQFIKDNNLEKDVRIHGWVDTTKALRDIGFVLSVSSNNELPESFHIAPAEGFASGNQGVFLYWNGVEYLYPDQYIFEDLDKMANYITANSNIDNFNASKSLGSHFIQKNYNLTNFIGSFHSMINEC